MWGFDGMLNKRIASLFFLGAVLLGSCTQKVSDTPLYGLIEGTYYYKSQEGTIPDGWSFSGDSYFKFKRNDSGKYSKHDWLPNGKWDMQKYDYTDESHHSLYTHEYVMEWHNTPFDLLDSLKPRGAYSRDDNTAGFPMYAKDELRTRTDSKWKGIVNVHCYIVPLQKSDYSKRKLTVECNYSTHSDKSGFSITFSM